MKNLLTAGLLALVSPAFAQNETLSEKAESATPFKKANVITIHTSDSASVAYGTLARLLLSAGYPLDKTDKELGYINTGYHAGKLRYVSESLQCVIVPKRGGALIEVRGLCQSNMPGARTTTPPVTIDCRGTFGNIVGEAWEEMNRFAIAYKAPVSYRYQP